MSLLTEQMEPFVMIDRTTQPDGYGGITPTWVQGAEFEAAVSVDNSTPARIGAVQGLTSVYNVLTKKSVVLHFHDVFQRKSDGKIFRATEDGTDKKTPRSAGLQLRQIHAEEWRLPDE